jgi:hypothetical protein
MDAGRIRRNAPWILLSTLVGAVIFVAAQHLAGYPAHIAQYMGREIVRRGGYSPGLAGLIGWGVHLGVATAYATLYGLIVLAPFFPKDRAVRWSAASILALLLGWLTSLFTAPAIAITIGILSGRGLPDTIPGLNTSLGFVFWNHVAFFVVGFVFTVAVKDIVSHRGLRDRESLQAGTNAPAGRTR